MLLLIQMKQKTIAIIGAGITGCSLARLLAEQQHQIEIYEQQSSVGGNCYDQLDDHGVLIHLYGPHIFHTNDDAVWAFAGRFTAFNNYMNHVLVEVNNQLVKMPINLDSIKTLYPQQFASFYEELTSLNLIDQSISIAELLKCLKTSASVQIIQSIYELVYVNYTKKMWGVPITEIDPTVLQRVKINLNTNWNYFPQDRYQGLPTAGYTQWFKQMIAHPAIKLNLAHRPKITRTKNSIIVDGKSYDLVIYTGMLDELFEYCYGHLPYRSLKIVFEHHPQPFYQSVGIINYPAHPTLTRICEYKYLTMQAAETTTISYEYPGVYNPHTPGWNIPFYPINNPTTAKIHQDYLKLSQQYSNLIVAGRLGHYQYYDMDDALAYCLQLATTIEKRFSHD